jgi:glycosyltransferase involved in cell wall biosynthesis
LDIRIFQRQARSLVAAGYIVTLIGSHDKDDVIDGVKIIATPKVENKYLRMLSASFNVFKLALQQKADIYHFHDPELIPISLLLRAIARKPVIYDVHEYYSDFILTKPWIPRFLRKPLSFIFERFEKNGSRYFSAIVTVNEHMNKKFKAYNPRSITLHNYPHRSFGQDIKLPQPRQKNYKVITYVGGISKSWGYETILKAMQIVHQKYPNTICQLIGSKNLAGVAEKYLNDKYLVDTGVTFIGRLPHEEIPILLHNSDIAWLPWPALPNNILGLPNKLFEYMACATPIVSSSLTFVSEIVKSAECGILVEPDNPQEHAEAIIYLIEHPDDAKRMGSNGREAFLDKYHWEIEEKKLIDLYSELTQTQ